MTTGSNIENTTSATRARGASWSIPYNSDRIRMNCYATTTVAARCRLIFRSKTAMLRGVTRGNGRLRVVVGAGNHIARLIPRNILTPFGTSVMAS